MKIASWNINSIRVRIDQVINILLKENIDILCLQEIKVTDSLFPQKIFIENGFKYLCLNGQKQYNGVAIISRIPFDSSYTKDFCNKEEKRHICIKLKNGIEIHNFYFPAGGMDPDVKTNIKFKEKLEYYNKVTRWFANKKNKRKLILLGDMNIAPSPLDVWCHKKLINVVSHTPIEIEYYNSLFKSLDWVDAIRYFMGEDKKIFTWWSYRNSDWKKANKGRRLDHIWVEKSLTKKIKDLKILSNTRQHIKPSDHIPIMIELKN